jgi:tetratricopeptide (TPR) repeat protein
MKDIFAVQDEITLAVVEALKVKLLGTELSAMLRKGTDNSEAYELYLRGRALWSRRTHTDFLKAIEYFERAIELDPEYTLACVGLADCYSFLAYFEAYSPAEMAPKAKAAVEKAMTLDPSLAECHASLALYKCFFELDVKAAESELCRAIEINPNSSVARYMHCSVLVALGRSEEAIDEGKLALKMDPLSPVVNVSLGRALCVAGLYEEAIDLSNKNFEILPDFFFSHWVLGWAYRHTGRLEEAIDHFRKATTGGGFTAYGYLGEAFVKAGRTDEALALLDELKQQQSEYSFVSPVGSAVIHAALGEMAEALDLFEKAWQIRSIHLMWYQVDPIFEVFRSEPGFNSLLKRLNSSIKV